MSKTTTNIRADRRYFRWSFLLCFSLFVLFFNFTDVHAATDDKVLFLHHSTGEGVWNGGGVASWFTSYNAAHGTSYQVTQRAYPDSPYPWQNYPYDYWYLWVAGNCNSSQSGIECMTTLTQNYDIIVFKHCFPGADVLADTGSPSISSDRKSLENYKLQYRALRTMMDGYPNNKFIVWTLAPLHRLATNASNAARAKQFVDWVKNDWLTEDGQAHPNIFVFDFYGYVAGSDNFLKYEYEGSHSSSDSHPNAAANAYVGPIFSQFIVDTAQAAGGSTPAPVCTENWSCGGWSACTNGQQTRTCADGNSCGTTSNKPSETFSCASGQVPSSDTIAPNTIVTASPASSVKVNRAMISWSGIDDQTSADNLEFSYQVDSHAWSAWTKDKSAVVSHLANGSHTVLIKSRDAIGNEDPSPSSITFTVQVDEFIVTAPNQGGGPKIKIFSKSGKLEKVFLAYEGNFLGGVSVATGDLDGNGTSEIITGSGPGRAPEVKIFRRDGKLFSKFFPYDRKFKGGIRVASGDINGDGKDEIIISARAGGSPQIRIYGYQNGLYKSVANNFMSYDSRFRGGVSITACDLDGDGIDEVITAPQSLSGPLVKAFSLFNGNFVLSGKTLTAYGATYKGGVSLACGDTNGDGKGELITGVMSQSGPKVKIFSRASGSSFKVVNSGFMAFSAQFRGGVAVGSVNLDYDSADEIIAGVLSNGEAKLRVYSANGKKVLKTWSAYSTSFRGGISVASGQ